MKFFEVTNNLTIPIGEMALRCGARIFSDRENHYLVSVPSEEQLLWARTLTQIEAILDTEIGISQL
jgi:hypothetical protein